MVLLSVCGVLGLLLGSFHTRTATAQGEADTRSNGCSAMIKSCAAHELSSVTADSQLGCRFWLHGCRPRQQCLHLRPASCLRQMLGFLDEGLLPPVVREMPRAASFLEPCCCPCACACACPSSCTRPFPWPGSCSGGDSPSSRGPCSAAASPSTSELHPGLPASFPGPCCLGICHRSRGFPRSEGATIGPGTGPHCARACGWPDGRPRPGRLGHRHGLQQRPAGRRARGSDVPRGSADRGLEGVRQRVAAAAGAPVPACERGFC